MLLYILTSFALARASQRPQSTSARMSYNTNHPLDLPQRLTSSQELAMLEQDVEDYNAQWVATAPDAIAAISKRRLICLPLDERFDPPMGIFSHGHVQTGDKMSIPKNFWQAIQVSQAEVR